MKASELRNKKPDELNNELIELRRAQFSLRMQAATQQLNKPDQIQKTRRDIARVKTIIAEKAKA
jgi:large subunit ribosomal protein L29